MKFVYSKPIARKSQHEIFGWSIFPNDGVHIYCKYFSEADLEVCRWETFVLLSVFQTSSKEYRSLTYLADRHF
jgi:hypothetical protein